MTGTKRWNISNSIDDAAAMEEAAALLKAGETVAFPTETVYGLGADATNAEAVSKIFKAKGRPQDNPLIAHVATVAQLRRIVDGLPEHAERLLEAFSPGPLTVVLKSNGACADNVTAGLATIGVRIPDHPVARELLLQADLPIAAPSANISGKPSPTLADHVWEDLHGRIAGLLDGGPTGVGLESTVIDCTQEVPTILRPGGITKEQLEEVIGHVRTDPGMLSEGQKPISPGMKYRHYSPELPLWLVAGHGNELQQAVDDLSEQGKRVGVIASTDRASQLRANSVIPVGRTIEEIASNLYHALRAFKKEEVDIILCELFPEYGIGQAVMNRLKKAASGNYSNLEN